MLFRSRFTRKKTIAAAAVGMGILMAANGVGLIVFGIEALSKVFLLTLRRLKRAGKGETQGFRTYEV